MNTENRERAKRLREQARITREYAKYADGSQYYRELREADALERMADELEKGEQS